jgi:hypothetical protein
MSKSAEAKSTSRLTGCERLISIVLAVALFAFAGFSSILQLHQTTTEIASDGSWKHTESPRDTSYFSIGASTIAAVLLLYAINGLRVARFSAGNIAVDTQPEKEAQRALDQIKSLDPAAEQPASSETPPESTATPEIVQTAKGKFESYKLAEVPVRVLQDAITKWPSGQDLPTDFTDFKFALRKTGRGNHPWIIKFRDRLPVTVSYGGKSKLEATVTMA